ncbi:MAG: glycoside hydrolase family 38 C-terminal domain-containing protein, partial [Rectinemataceae bacterium]
AQTLAFMAGLPSSRARTDELWKETLLYQFHDILPGSSVARVYLESLARLALLRNEAEAERLRILSELGSRESGASLVNQAPFSRQSYAKVDSSWMRADVPAYGASRLRPASPTFSSKHIHSASCEILENDLLRAVFSPNGSLVSLADKATGFESCGAWLNRLVVYCDPWRYYNAWDILDGYWRLPKKVLIARTIETSVDGPRVTCRSTYRHGRSYIVQDAILEEGSAVLEFGTIVEWHETFRMLRADFRPSFSFDRVRCDIQFGSIERSARNDTSAERAQFEVCAHRYVDVSDGQRGLALLNDCKYGHRVKGGLVSLALLRSPLYPDPKADRGEHRFRYGLLPHAGDAFTGEVIREATLFNQGPLVVEDGPEGLPRFSVEPENVLLDTIKVAESGEGLVLRLFECQGKDTVAKVGLPEGWTRVVETNLLEEELGPVDSGDLRFGPFQIRTILVRREGAS